MSPKICGALINQLFYNYRIAFMETLEIVIGIVFIFLLLSLLGTIIQEMVSTVSSLRGKVLLDALVKFLENKLIEEKDPDGEKKSVSKRQKANDLNFDIRQAIKENKVYRNLKSTYLGKEILPSYLSSEQALTIIKEVMDQQFKMAQKDNNVAAQSLTSKANTLSGSTAMAYQQKGEEVKYPEEQAYQAKSIYSVNGEKPVQELRKFCSIDLEEADPQKVEEFVEAKEKMAYDFEEVMDRSSGWFKRRVQERLLLIGLAIAIAFNADTVQIYQKLTDNPEDRQSMLALAESFINNSKGDAYMLSADKSAADISQPDTVILQEIIQMRSLVDSLIKNEIGSVRSPLGLGWDAPPTAPNGEELSSGAKAWWVVKKIPGWLITALAISLGSPFWFDLLNRLINLRNAGKRPEVKQKNRELPKTSKNTLPPIEIQQPASQ